MYCGVPSMAPVRVSEGLFSRAAFIHGAIGFSDSMRVAFGSSRSSTSASHGSTLVSDSLILGDSGLSGSCSSSTDFEMPKSMTLTNPSLETIKFDGLISRCTTPWLAASRSPIAAWRIQLHACSTEIEPSRLTTCWNVSPSTYSISMKGWFFHIPTRYTLVMLGWSSFAASFASRRNRSIASLDSCSPAIVTLTATERLRTRS